MNHLRAIHRFLRTVAAILGAVVIFWAAVPSTMFVRATDPQVYKDGKGWVMAYSRDLPFGPVTLDYELQIVVVRPDGNYICSKNGTTRVTDESVDDGLTGLGASETTDAGSPVRLLRLGEWASECLDKGPPLAITWMRSVKILGGLLPLRPDFRYAQVRP